MQLGMSALCQSGHSLSNQTARIAWPVLIPSGLISNSARGSLALSPVDKKGPLRVTPHSDPPTVGRKYGNHPLGDCPAFRAFDDRSHQTIRLCGRSQALLESAFL